jgi:rubredoxin
VTATYHPDPKVNAEVTADALEAEFADLRAGYPPRRWRCPECETEHSRGHFGAIGVHRCLSCGYAGTGGIMLDEEESDEAVPPGD